MEGKRKGGRSGRKGFPLCVLGLGALLLGLTAADLSASDRLFSEQENRLLAERPAFSWKGLLDGSFGREYESYLTDQFVGRDGWIRLKTNSQLALGERELRSVYFAGDDTLIERHTEETVDAAQAERKREKLAAFVGAVSELPAGGREQAAKTRLAVMLVPTADCIWEEKLSPWAEEFDQLSYLEEIGGVCNRIPVEQTLRTHAREPIYYRTDHHWTTLGAFYGYEAFCGAFGFEAPSLEEYEITEVTDTFLGTLHSRVNVAVKPDSICVFSKKGQQASRVFDLSQGETETRLYACDRLKTKDAYSFFLGGNAPLLRVDTGVKNGRTLLLIKDSYANCFAPFLIQQYERIYVTDPRYYRGSLEELAAQTEPADILILYDVIHFIENF